MNKKLSACGFLLFEVMLSVAVITGGVLFVVRPLMTARAVVAQSRELLTASLLLDNRMRELEQAGIIATGAMQGDFTGNPRYEWASDSVRNPGERYNTVTMKVRAKGKPDVAICSITTYINGVNDAQRSA